MINYGSLGIVWDFLKEHAKAINFYKIALKIAREIPDRQNEGIQIGNIGVAYGFLKQYDKEIEQYLIALEIAKETRDSKHATRWCENLLAAYRDAGNMEKALYYFGLLREQCGVTTKDHKF